MRAGYNPPMNDLDACFEPVREIWRKRNWPGVVEELSYGTPALKVRGKLLVRLREPDVVVLMVDLDEKEFLMEVIPDVFFETNHYRDYPAVLARLSKIDPDELESRIEATWRRSASKKMIAEFEAAQPLAT